MKKMFRHSMPRWLFTGCFLCPKCVSLLVHPSDPYLTLFSSVFSMGDHAFILAYLKFYDNLVVCLTSSPHL